MLHESCTTGHEKHALTHNICFIYNDFRISSAAVLKNVADGDGKIVKGGGWFQAHRIMLSLAALLGIIGFILIFVDHKVRFTVLRLRDVVDYN